MTVHGMGKSPADTTITGLTATDGGKDPSVGALCNFWRGAENLRVFPDADKFIWAVSQASPLRRMIVDDNMDLYQYVPPYIMAGYASGGYMSDMTINGVLTSGSQQQFFTRNSKVD